MYNLQLLTILEKVLGKSYQLKNGENAFYCPFCHHHKKKMQVNFKTQKWHFEILNPKTKISKFKCLIQNKYVKNIKI